MEISRRFRDPVKYVALLSVFAFLFLCPIHSYPGEEKHDIGTLAGDVQNWAMLIQNYILQLASDGINKDYSQSYLDQASYTYERKDGEVIVMQVKEKLEDYFQKKKKAAEELAKSITDLYDSFALQRNKSLDINKLSELGESVYRDSDIPSRLPSDLKFSPYYRQAVSINKSTIKISDEVPRDDPLTVETIHYTAELEKIFKKNAKNDDLLRWQYFGSNTGIVRIYPGREWSTNFAGFYNDYDPRVRPWYIAATSGPKDVVIILDCSLSMTGEKFSIAKAVAKAVIDTLTKQDYMNVICARASYWDEVGKWHFYSTKPPSCQSNSLVPATIAHRKDLKEKIDQLEAGGTSELEKSFDLAFDLLNHVPRTGCQSVIILATDGLDTDGEDVRCGPGYYTRSGYVPGPICKYNWTRVWAEAEQRNARHNPKARIFSYLMKENAEIFPGKLACDHQGSMKKLVTGENLISQMSNYFDFLTSNAVNKKALWTSPYLDAWGLELLVTYAIPIISNVTKKTIGVVGIDATLEEMENFLKKHQWGTVYSFLINDKGETIYHPRLTPSTNLRDDPIFIPITQLEQDKDGNPSEFSTVLKRMKDGLNGSLTLNKRTYYYSGLEGKEYSFAYSFSKTDLEFRRSQEPKNSTDIPASYFNLLKEYNSDLVRKELPGVYEEINVKEKESKYPGLRITYDYSTIFLPPMAYCDPTHYKYDENLARKTLQAHKWINGREVDRGCDSGEQMFHKGIRADVLITQPIENIWKERDFESLDQVKWTNIGLRSGVFRTYPGHRSTRLYNPVKRPWYKGTSAQPHRTSISTPYMDAAGVGKIVTISQAVFEGMTPKTDEECKNISKTGPWPGGCKCNVDEDCIVRAGKKTFLRLSHPPNGNKTALDCIINSVTTSDNHKIHWKRNGGSMAAAGALLVDWYNIIPISRYVKVERLVIDTNGIYECNHKVYWSGPLIVQSEPIIYAETEQRGILGDSISVNVSIIFKSPGATIDWKYNDASINHTSAFVQDRIGLATAAQPSLQISTLTMADEGMYQVTASNDYGTSNTTHINLVVQYKPIIVVTQNTYYIYEGQDVVLEVTITANPELTSIQWMNGSTILFGNNILNGNLLENSLMILKVDRWDNGTYHVKATNAVGSDSSGLIELVVKYPPDVLIPVDFFPVDDGLRLTVPCYIIDAYPSASSVVWYKDNAMLNVSSRVNTFFNVNVNTAYIEIENTTIHDSGSYVCSVTNEAGTSNSEPVTVSVIYDKPQIALFNTSYRVKEGDSVVLGVDIDGNPELVTIQWMRNLSVVSGNRIRDGNMCENSLMITDAARQDEGIYQVFATNEFNSSSAFISIDVIYPPKVEIPDPIYSFDSGQSPTIPCNILEAYPNVTSVEWFKSCAQINSSISSGKFSGGTVENPDLIINNITQIDNGSYHCRATNEAGTGESGVTAVLIKREHMPIYSTCRYCQKIDDTNIEGKIMEIRTNVSVEKNSTSAYRRRLGSQPDTRKSSNAVGTVGTMVIILWISIVAMFDLVAILQKRRPTRVGNAPK